jgi:uncharacterized protein (UPF0335 family)
MMGDNVAGALKDFCDRFDRLLETKKELTENRKSVVAEMKNLNMPVSGIQKIRAEKKKENAEEQRKEMESAAVLLGVTVYTAEATPTDDPFSDQDKSWAQEKVEELDEIDTQIKSVGEDVKELLKEAKAEGFTSKLIPQVCEIRKDPDSYKENSVLLSSYLTAVGVAV